VTAGIEVVDALGRVVQLAGPARRVVSLVPSETESVVVLAGRAALVGRTEFCVEPSGAVDDVPTVGGTKSVDIDAVVRLAPDLVLANKEENTRSAVESLIDRGLTVHVSFPCTARESLAWLRSLCLLLGLDPGREAAVIDHARALEDAHRDHPSPGVRVFVPIWRDPWMTFDSRSFASDLLALSGAVNVFAGRARRYPLAAELGTAPEASAASVAERDTRYPRISLSEVIDAAPDLVLLPDEPFAFGHRDVEELMRLPVPAASDGRIWCTSGRDLFWYGVRFSAALARVCDLVSRARARQSVHT